MPLETGKMMERRDILKDEIEALGRVLGKLLASILGTEGSSTETDGMIAQVSETFKTELNIDLDTFLTIPAEDVKPYLKERNFQPANLESLSNILLEAGKRTALEDPVKARLYYSRVLDLYSLMDQVYGSISLDRYQKESWLQSQLKQ